MIIAFEIGINSKYLPLREQLSLTVNLLFQLIYHGKN